MAPAKAGTTDTPAGGDCGRPGCGAAGCGIAGPGARCRPSLGIRALPSGEEKPRGAGPGPRRVGAERGPRRAASALRRPGPSESRTGGELGRGHKARRRADAGPPGSRRSGASSAHRRSGQPRLGCRVPGVSRARSCLRPPRGAPVARSPLPPPSSTCRSTSDTGCFWAVAGGDAFLPELSATSEITAVYLRSQP